MISNSEIAQANPDLIDMLQPGKSVKIYYGEDNINNRVHHIRAIVDGRYIYREWSKKRQGWIYGIETLYYYLLRYESGGLTLYKAKHK